MQNADYGDPSGCCKMVGGWEAAMECKKSENLTHCTCTYEPCSRKGTCCDCIRYHLRTRQLPGCFFPPYAEATFDRSFEHFARMVTSGKI
jgi:hypothetical protein